MLKRLVNLDRRLIFGLVILVIVLAWVFKLHLPIRPAGTVEAVYNKIESLPEGSVVLIASDYDPQSMAELYPMNLALVRHCFRKNLKVIGMVHWITGLGLAEMAIKEAAQEYHKQDSVDYVFLGYKPGFALLVIGMGQDLYNAFPTDYYGKDTRTIPMLKEIASLKDINYLVDLAAGASIEMWIVYGRDIYNFPMGAGCTAMSGPDMYPFLQTGQLNGLLAGIRGAADYEVLLKKGRGAIDLMPAQTAIHCLIVLLVIICNIFYFFIRRSEKQTT